MRRCDCNPPATDSQWAMNWECPHGTGWHFEPQGKVRTAVALHGRRNVRDRHGRPVPKRGRR